MSGTFRAAILVGLATTLIGCGPKVYKFDDPKLTQALQVHGLESLSSERYPYWFSVQLLVLVDERGVLLETELVGADGSWPPPTFEGDWGQHYLAPEVQQAALAALRSASFVPARIGDEPVRQRGVIEVTFNSNGRVILPPKIKKHVPPEYPEEFRLQRIQGLVVLEILIDEHGQVKEIHPLLGKKRLVDSVIECTLGSTYTPALLDGKPIPVRICIPYKFALLE